MVWWFVFFMIISEPWVWGKITEVKCHFNHIVSRAHTIDLTYRAVKVELGHPAQAVCQVSVPSLHTVLSGGKSGVEPPLEDAVST